MISYASEQRKFVEELQIHLSELISSGQIRVDWDDRKDRETYWDDAIKAMFEEADGYIMLFSVDYMRKWVTGGQFIHDYERPVIKRKKDGGIYECCIWAGDADCPQELSRFNHFQKRRLLPNTKKGRDRFYTDFVQQEIKGQFLKL